MSDTASATTAMRGAGRRAAVSAAITGIIAALLIGAVVPWVSDILLFSRASYAEVTVTAVDERTVVQRARYAIFTVRQVEVTMPDGGVGHVESTRIQVGETAPVWRQSETGELFDHEPARPGLADWAWVGAAALAAILFLLAAVGGLRKSLALFRADPERAPRVRLRVTEAGEPTSSGGSRRHPHVPVVAEVTDSDHPRTPAGETVRFDLRPARLPGGALAAVPAELDGRVVHQGAFQTVMAVRGAAGEPWAVVTA